MSNNTELVQQGIAAVKAGNLAAARLLFANVLQTEPENEVAWLWLSGAVASNAERKYCIERVLTINPNNQAAKKDLSSLGDVESKNPLPTTATINTPKTPFVLSRGVQRLPYKRKVQLAALSRDGLYLATIDDQFQLSLWRVSDKQKQWTTEDVFGIGNLMFSPDGTIVAVSSDSCVEFFETRTGKLVKNLKIPSDKILYSEDGKSLIIANSLDQLIYVVDPRSGQKKRSIKTPNQVLKSVDFSANGQWIAATFQDQGCFVWSAIDGRLAYQFNDDTIEVCFHPTSKYLASSELLGAVRIRNVNNGEFINSVGPVANLIRGLKWSPDGSRFVVWDNEAEVYMYDAIDYQLQNAYKGKAGKIEDVILSSREGQIIIRNEDGTVEFWSIS